MTNYHIIHSESVDHHDAEIPGRGRACAPRLSLREELRRLIADPAEIQRLRRALGAVSGEERDRIMLLLSAVEDVPVCSE